MARRHPERDQQEALVTWAAWMAATEAPELALLHHIPNGGHRNVLTAVTMKRLGVKPGVPDLCLPVARDGYHGLYIEMKADGGRARDNQKWWHAQLTEQGYCVVICREWGEAADKLLTYLGYPPREEV